MGVPTGSTSLLSSDFRTNGPSPLPVPAWSSLPCLLYSDTLLIFLLKGAVLEKYKDRVEKHIKGKEFLEV